jgi:phosphoribosylanthranilate isomerase
MTWVKICGMTNLEDALVAVDAGADAVGFVFHDKSPRCVTVEKAREIVAKLPAGVEKVGVFVDADCEQMREIVVNSALTAVQLHGKSSLESVLTDSRPANECVGVSKVILMIPGNALQDGGIMISRPARDKAFALLIDSAADGVNGGSGKTFDWSATRGMVQGLSLSIPVIVAGGLNPLNVGEAMRMLQPFGVDVVSGVEASPGKKDPEKVRAFVKAVRGMDRKAG